MSTGTQPALPPEYKIGELVATPRPKEVVFSLTLDKYELLQATSVGIERSARDTTAGMLVGALVGLIGFLATADFDKHPICLAILLAITGIAAVCFCTFAAKCHLAKPSRVKEEIDDHFGITKKQP